MLRNDIDSGDDNEAKAMLELDARGTGCWEVVQLNDACDGEEGMPMRRKSIALCFAEDKFALALAMSVLVDLDPDESRLSVEPVDSPDPTFPSTSHALAPLLIRLRHFPLRPGATAKCFPLRRGDTCQKGRVQRVKQVEVRDGSAAALLGAAKIKS